MKRISSRSGSALLIVLGMLSFMIISAVGFAAYMRYSRQPSSFLRRSSSTRQLAKAALAEAIDQIDRAIGNNPHPGVGNAHTSGAAWNGWQGRVFTGTNATLNVSGGDAGYASPLCLEALAYIPPPLVNEARYYSRFTPTAAWQQLSFDAGRFCWLALDVSDYFDINRLMANKPRSSSPNRRISLAYLFENMKHDGMDGSLSPEAWDKFMEKFRGKPDDRTQSFTFKGQEPLISIADFNLALDAYGSNTGFTSPFCDYVEATGGRSGFYGTESERDEDIFRRMTFVTDSHAPASTTRQQTPSGETVYDLNDEDYQPFSLDRLDATPGQTALAAFVPSVSSTMQRATDWASRLGGLGCAALFDYLDTDHYPVSLAIPTTERVPMICGIKPKFDGAFTVAKSYEPSGDGPDDVQVKSGDEKTRIVRKTVKYNIGAQKLMEGFMGGFVDTLVTFPFAHPRADDGNFTIDGRFSLFFSTEEMRLRTGEQNDLLHLADKNISTTLNNEGGIITAKLSEQGLPTFTSIRQPSDAVKRVAGLTLREGVNVCRALSMAGNELLTVTFEWEQTLQEESVGGVLAGGKWLPVWGNNIWEHPEKYAVEAKCNVKAVRATGTTDPDLEQNKITDLVKGGYDNGKDVWLNGAVTLRVKESGRVVDMVPACVLDDKIQNNANIGPLGMGGGGTVAAMIAGQQFPIFRFDTGVKFRLSLKGLDNMAEMPITLDPAMAMVSDPRWNHAPEHWYAKAGDLTEQEWLTEQEKLLGQDGRDDDIFMATSDAGYLQSIYELAFLPRLTDLRTTGNRPDIGNMESLGSVNYTSIPSSWDKTLNKAFVWRTYDPFSDEGREAFEDIPRTSAGGGCKVNPYSDSTNILMAAFANTPIDWNRASTNVVEGQDYKDSTTAKEFNTKSARNAYSSAAKIKWHDLEQIAGRFKDLTRQHGNWETAWNKLDWYGDEDSFCGVTLDNETDDLWTADRKFLYGFWRDCFAARQQLFLVFIRAEPMMMGSSGNDQVPPQLGARAVAVVWRDPTESKNEQTPHQTRVLFYRQFE